MIFSVVWMPRAEQRLAELWLAASDRAAMTCSADSIDARLSRSPFDEGESREGDLRIAFEAPLAVKYHIDATNRVVQVVRVWTI